jgi:hypothetical protein
MYQVLDSSWILEGELGVSLVEIPNGPCGVDWHDLRRAGPPEMATAPTKGVADSSVKEEPMATKPTNAMHAIQMTAEVEIGQDLFVGLLDRSGSTGLHWKHGEVPKGLTLSEEEFAPEHQKPGAPSVRAYRLKVDMTPDPNPGPYHVHFEEMSPTPIEPKQPVECVDVTINVPI